MEYVIATVLGTIYGLIFGIIPVAGAATGLITVYSFLDVFQSNPYLLVAFTTSFVVACSIGDSFSSIVLNIPGAGGAAATMVDGFPMARRGEAARALSAALTTSASNGLLWGILVFAFLPFYGKLIMNFGIPEMLAFVILASTSVVFLNSQYWFRGIVALCLGVFLGLVGTNPLTNQDRFTGGWFYLAHGIQIIPVIAGVLAFPELIEALLSKAKAVNVTSQNTSKQIIQGIKDSWNYRWDGLRGGAIGGFIGLLPGVGGSVADWLAYGQTVAVAKNDSIPFGEGNVRGVVGAEGANNSQKATAYIPTVLFGIPGAPFEAVIIALFMYVGLEMGSPTLLADLKFFDMLSLSYMLGLLLTTLLGFFIIRYAIKITTIPFKYTFFPVLALILWSCVQYTGGWEDYAMFAICCVAGMLFKQLKLSRAALIIGFVLAPRIESLTRQFTTLYTPVDLLNHPIAICILLVALTAAVYGIFFNRAKVNYV